MNNNNDDSVLLSPKISGSNQLPSSKLHVLESRSFRPVKSFALDVNLSAVPGRTNSNKLISIKKIFYKIDGFGGASTSSKFPGVIHSTFTNESSLIKARKMAVCEKIVVNSDLKKANIHLNQEVIVKEISVDLLKLAVESALIEFESSEVASLAASKWSVLMGKDLVHVALTVNNKQTWASRDHHWALLYTLSVGTSAYDLSELLVLYGRRTCFIGCNPGLYVHNQCAIICFENEDVRLAAVSTILIFKGVSLHWASFVLASCIKCEQFGHITINCLVGGSSGVREKRVKKSAPIACPVLFGGKTWTQVASGTSFCVSPSGFPGSGLYSGLVPPLAVSNHLVVSHLNNHLAVLEHSLELLANCVSGILVRLDSFGVVSLVPSSLALPPAVSAALSSEVDSDMIVDNALSSSDITPPITIDAVVDLNASSSKVLTVKVHGLKIKLVALEASVGSVLDKLNLLCSGLGLSAPIDINICTKQADIFDGVCIFTSKLDSGHMGSGVVIILDSSLAKHVCKVSEVPGQLLLVRLLFKNKLSVSILGLYAGASSAVRFSQAGKINSLIVKTVNESSFVILGGDFNEDDSYKYASFKKCFDLGLINFLGGSSFMKSLTWCNSCGITKTISYMLISSNLAGAVMDCDVDGIEDYFDTNYKAVSVSVELGGLLNVQLNSLHKQANRDRWKYDIKNANEVKWSEFMNAMAANAIMFSDEFVAAKQFFDLDIMVLSAGGTFKKKWFKGFNCVFNKVFSWFHKLELLVSKLVKASWLVSGRDFALLLNTWYRLDSVDTLPVRSLFLSGSSFNAICSELAKAKKSYHSSKLLESKHAEESYMRQAIKRRMESFEMNKDHIIRSVLERLFHKVVLDHLVNNEELVLEPELVKSKMDEIMEVTSDISDDWTRQFQPLDYVFDSAFSNVMYSIGFDKMFGVISNLPDGKAAGLSGITNELWKCCDKLVLDMLLVLLNFCLDCESWKEIFTNIHPIALIETACKVLSKIFLDQISLACSTFDVLHKDNFSVLKDMSTQSPIFAIGLRSLIRIKMCDKFIRFFGHIHNGCTNKVIMNFGLTDGYQVHDRLDQGKVFSPLLWYIFYDPLLCEAGLTSFLAASAFIDDIIWVGSSQAATQHILNVASDFFYLNNISINNDKTVTIPINCQVTAPYLTICGLPISITKRSEPHYYLEIFLFSNGLSKPSLVKTHSDVWFFTNLILKKVVSDKQFAYLVFSVLFLIVSYRTQFSYIPLSVCLKSKFGLPLDFPNDALHHSSLYNLKTFEQIQTESKLAFVITFANLFGVLGRLFSHKAHDFQVFSWRSHYPLLFLVHVRVSPSNNFLASVVCIFSGCDLSLEGSLASAFCLRSGTSMSLVLGEMIFFKCVSFLKCYGIAFVEQLCDRNGIVFDWKTFKHWKRLDPCGPVPFWFDLSVHFLGGVASPSDRSFYEGVCGSSDIRQSLGFGVICNDLLNVGATHLFVYTDRSLSNLGTVDILADMAVFFEDIDSGLGVGISGLAIALALKCVPSFRLVDLFLDSQMAIDACRLESLLVGPDFKNCCWIEHCHITNVICHKNLDVNWIKVKSHLGVSDNERADALAKNAAFSAWHLPHLVSERFLKTGIDVVSGNLRHFVCCLHVDINWLRSSLVWHLDFYMTIGFTSIQMAGFHTYFMKAFHHHFPVAVRKRLYDRDYPSVVCLFYGEIEISDYVFFCSSNTDNRAVLLNTYAAAWEVRSGLFCSFLCVSQLLLTCISDVTVSMALCKSFSVSVYKDSKVAVINIMNFVHEFCLAFCDSIWLVRVKHQAIMEKNKLIPHDGSIPVAVSGFSTWLLAGVTKLLGVANALGVNFGYHKHYLFYAGVGNMAFVHISV
ncbi:hypothetical protein G9A89_023694 [Geosiphon pyriformis]|nr:hypothetical protein G9A89_023694 [Geosiphon pyriformis]